MRTWENKENPAMLISVIDDIMSHPCKTDWMDNKVIDWAAKNQDKVRRLEKSSYLQIAKEQQQKLMANIEKEKQYRDLACNNLINYYEKQHA
ncbi:MAG: hypothetical protein JXB34_09110 [Bacteroidales bacterium]|nr:hypothetical protein [Bacteroidales bacterium]